MFQTTNQSYFTNLKCSTISPCCPDLHHHFFIQSTSDVAIKINNIQILELPAYTTINYLYVFYCTWYLGMVVLYMVLYYDPQLKHLRLYHHVYWFKTLEKSIISKHLPAGNQTWQWNMFHLQILPLKKNSCSYGVLFKPPVSSMIFPIKTSIFIK